ncbi:hypothetical protein Daus18300_000174 [Diaporthe australafricana]|uniref:Uncharacterized protein n=1 Tax=Diaporthe australafricana TaxID=127596 RepID=A0ABR3Y6Z1_9PEZI
MSHKSHGEENPGGQDDPSFSAPPPSYIEATVPSGSQSRPPTYPEKPNADPIDELVSRLPSLIRERQQSQASQRLSEDDALVQHIVPFIQEFFLDFSTDNHTRNSRESLSMELMLVPQDAARRDEGWTLAGINERREQCVFSRLNEIATPDKLKWVSKNGESIQVRDDAAETDTLWWRDEQRALRLASALRGIVTPERPQGSEAQRDVDVEEQQPPEQSDSKGKSPARSFFGLSRKSRSPVERTAPKIQTKSFATVSLGSVQVHVQAEEVTLRRENDFGLWESSSGWAIVINATILY